jgi:hypothetical protein
MSGRSHWRYVTGGHGLAEDEQDIAGQPVAGVLEQEPDRPLDRGAQVAADEGLGQDSQPSTFGIKIDFPSIWRCACNFTVYRRPGMGAAAAR